MAQNDYGFDYGEPDPNAGYYQTQTQPTYGSTGGQTSGNFFDDPLMQYVEGVIRQRIDTANQPYDTSFLDPVRSALFGGGSGGGGGGGDAAPTAEGAGDPLAAYRSYIGSFNPNDSGLAQYAAQQNPQQYAQELQGYAGTRDPSQFGNMLQQQYDQLGPNQSIADLQSYIQSRNPMTGVDELRQYMQNFDPTAGYREGLQSRIDQLRGNPFDDQTLATRRVGAFDQMEQDRAMQKQRIQEEMAARGIDQSSGLYARAMQDVDRRFDQNRAYTQNQMAQQEFQLSEQRNAQADQLEAQAAQMQMQSGQIAAGLMSQIAQMQQQGVGMQDALMQGMASLGIQDRGQQMNMMQTIATLTQQGYQMQDALQIAVSQMGLQAQSQADALRVALANTGLQAQGLQLQGQSSLAGFDVGMRGQDLALQGQLAQAGATSGAANLGALVSFAGLQNQIAQQQQGRQDQAINWALALNNMGRESFSDMSQMFPNF